MKKNLIKAIFLIIIINVVFILLYVFCKDWGTIIKDILIPLNGPLLVAVVLYFLLPDAIAKEIRNINNTLKDKKDFSDNIKGKDSIQIDKYFINIENYQKNKL